MSKLGIFGISKQFFNGLMLSYNILTIKRFKKSYFII